MENSKMHKMEWKKIWIDAQVLVFASRPKARIGVCDFPSPATFKIPFAFSQNLSWII